MQFTKYSRISQTVIPGSTSPGLQRMILNSPLLQPEARLKQGNTKTVAMTVVSHLLSPTVFFAVWRALGPRIHRQILTLLSARHVEVFSNPTNPIIYVFGTERYWAAIRQLVKDTWGTSPFRNPFCFVLFYLNILVIVCPQNT